MNNIKISYIKNESGDIVAPVTSEKCVYDDNGKTPSDKYALSTHTHSYLPLSGGTMTGTINSENIYPSKTTTYSLGSSSSIFSSVNATAANIYYGSNTSVVGAFQIYYGSHLMLLAPNVSNGAVRILKKDTSTFAAIDASAFNVSSSRRYKKNIKNMTDEEADKILDVNVVTFDYINENNGTDCRGVIAEDVYDIIPSVVSSGVDSEGNYHEIDSVDYAKFTPYLIKKVQMLEERLKTVENELNK